MGIKTHVHKLITKLSETQVGRRAGPLSSWGVGGGQYTHSNNPITGRTKLLDFARIRILRLDSNEPLLLTNHCGRITVEEYSLQIRRERRTSALRYMDWFVRDRTLNL